MIEDNIPQEIVDAALKFAEQENLSIYWLNSGPSELVKHLPADWRSTVQPLYSGDGLKLSTLSRDNLIKAKIWAYCDRTKDYDDVISMLPSKGELAETQAWLYPLDANPGWSNWVDECILKLSRGLGYE